MKANRPSTIELPRKPGGAFFRWETPGEPIAVHFQLNIVDLLERDLGYGSGKGRAGILLGRIECGRKLTLIVEDYESTSSLTESDTSGKHQEQEHELLGKIVDRWNSKSEKRISILGFYRTCLKGKVSLSSDDLKISSAHLTEPERIFLLIEPQIATVSRATLYMLRDGAVAWQWHSVPFNRKELTEKGSAVRPPASALALTSPKPKKARVPEKHDDSSPTKKQSKAAPGALWAIGIATTLAVVAGGIYSLRGTEPLRALSGLARASDNSTALGLKIQRVGNDWQLSWVPTAPVLRKAAAGHLSITDGFAHRNVDLDMNELRSGSIMYTPATDDATMHLEIVNAESATMADGTVRMLAGLPPSRPDAVRSIGDLPDNRSHAGNAKSTISASNPALKSSTVPGSLSTKAPIPFTLSAPKALMGHEVVSLEEPIATSVLPVTQQSTNNLSHSFVDPTPPILFPNANGANSNLSSSAGPVLHVATADMVKPAELIMRRDPVYPAFAKMSHTTGTVELQFRVSATGKIEDVTVVRGSPALAPAAIEAVKSWRYKPAEIKGTPVVSAVSTIIVFKLD